MCTCNHVRLGMENSGLKVGTEKQIKKKYLFQVVSVAALDIFANYPCNAICLGFAMSRTLFIIVECDFTYLESILDYTCSYSQQRSDGYHTVQIVF